MAFTYFTHCSHTHSVFLLGAAMKKFYWFLWTIISLAIASYFANIIFYAEDKSELIIGEATHGHHQIEMSCSSCHTDAFGGKEVIQEACVTCHGNDLNVARDSHPKKKFTSPRNADLINILDARYCVSCHTEHQSEQAHAMGLTLPQDYCFHCHENVIEERDSHKDLAFDSCASAGCHNYHDNRALFEDFLAHSIDAPWVSGIHELASANAAHTTAKKPSPMADEFIEQRQKHPDIEKEWLTSQHAKAGVNCHSCHTDTLGEWLQKPTLTQCESCHQDESAGFLAGKHGMRLAVGLEPLTPSMSPLAFKDDMLDTEHGCTSCHGAHSVDKKAAAVTACMSCHDDQHTRAFNDSPHGQLTQQALNNEISWGKAVTCATCHMPRLLHGKENSAVDITTIANIKGGATVKVQHNQSDMLRPNEKMIRPVCMSCHSLSFAIDALADEHLIDNNFSGKPKKPCPIY
jgi:hypothetical protein